jgi:hypothetical protein
VPYCTNCGTQERDDQKFCAVCGAASSGSSAAVPMPSMSSMPSMPVLAESEWTGEAQVRIGFSMDPARQKRWTIFLRVFLSFPLLIVAAVINIVAGLFAVGAWFCALITGRVPDDIQRFITNALRLYANVLFYACFLTSRWPGISFNPKPNDQVTLDIDHVNLNRWAVFFRYPLLIPSAIVGGLLFYGSYPVLVVMWLWGTITGREPRPLHQALSLALRFQIRYQAFASMMTPTQPFKGLFGDGKILPSTEVATSVGLDPTTSPQVALPQSVSPPTPSTPTQMTTSAFELTNRWFVVKGAKVVLIVILVLSIPAYVLPFTILSTSLDSFPFVNYWKTVFARVIVSGTEQNVAHTMNQFEVAAQTCEATHPHTTLCVTNAAAQAYSQLTKQTSLLQNNVFFPSSSLNQAVRYEATLDTLQVDLVKIENSTSFQFDQAIFNNVIPKALTASNAAYKALNAQLHK